MFRHPPYFTLRTLVFCLGTGCLTACLFDFGGDQDSLPTPAIVKPGIYRGYYGADLPEFDSELSLGFDGNFRWFAVDRNVVVMNQFGKWNERQGQAIFYQTERSQYTGFPEVFEDFQPTPSDSAPVRNTTRDGFEKYEISPNGGRGIWVAYRRVSHERLNPGKYVFRETTFTADTAGNVDTTEMRSEFQLRSGSNSGLQVFYKDTATMDIDIPSWSQVGSFLIAEGPRRRFRVDSLGGFGDWADTLDGEWVFRIQVNDDVGFQYWDFSRPDWIEYRREP